ncbi:MAG: zinc ABC transporter substrate-binding protein [Desulfarculaceae bacterium]|nr:zinc ABC transporter substrate-binding protein [Desulfarculaceae bacterium]MCF8074173.1 zinc ABC transporter substrate-binding protein [Desulfarculaceae bacterium]MCF8102754.1 zinc ABC transporter substrate-binding protein [Desulfarculaceae bacterium]MCF8116391.1 zinc ABC transporter substrate-binding protein [Desulfarculaceae bacterium]
MRRVLLACLLLTLLCPAALAAPPVLVGVSIPPQAWLVSAVGGPYVKPLVLLPPGASPATYEPGPRQLASLGGARLYLSIGVPFERSLLPRLAASFPKLKVAPMQAGIKLRRLKGHHRGRDQQHLPGHEPGAPDPHVWLGPGQMMTLAANTARALSALDPAHADEFAANLSRVQARLKGLDARLAHILAPLKGHTVLVYHPAYGYLLDTYGLKQEAVELEGKEPGPRRLAAIVSEAKKEGIRVIFVQPQFSPASARALARAINGVVVSLDPLARDYPANLKAMAEALAKGLE